MSPSEGDAHAASPLLGVEIVVTRPAHSAGPFVSTLRALGADVIEAPLIELAPPPDPDALKRRLGRLVATSSDQVGAEWLLLTSVNAARVTLNTLGEVTTREGAQALQDLTAAGLKVGCVGEKTARYLTSRGVEVAVTPRRFIAEGLLEALSEEGVQGARVLFPRALKAREWLVSQLTARGAEVELIPAYQTLSVTLSRSLKDRLFTAPPQGVRRVLTFTSDSTVESFMSQWERPTTSPQSAAEWPLWRVAMSHAEVCVIGPTVASCLERCGVKVDAIAEPHSTAGMTEAVLGLVREPVEQNRRH